MNSRSNNLRGNESNEDAHPRLSVEAASRGRAQTVPRSGIDTARRSNLSGCSMISVKPRVAEPFPKRDHEKRGSNPRRWPRSGEKGAGDRIPVICAPQMAAANSGETNGRGGTSLSNAAESAPVHIFPKGNDRGSAVVERQVRDGATRSRHPNGRSSVRFRPSVTFSMRESAGRARLEQLRPQHADKCPRSRTISKRLRRIRANGPLYRGRYTMPVQFRPQASLSSR